MTNDFHSSLRVYLRVSLLLMRGVSGRTVEKFINDSKEKLIQVCVSSKCARLVFLRVRLVFYVLDSFNENTHLYMFIRKIGGLLLRCCTRHQEVVGVKSHVCIPWLSTYLAVFPENFF